jgi:hypothetical protein
VTLCKSVDNILNEIYNSFEEQLNTQDTPQNENQTKSSQTTTLELMASTKIVMNEKNSSKSNLIKNINSKSNHPKNKKKSYSEVVKTKTVLPKYFSISTHPL